MKSIISVFTAVIMILTAWFCIPVNISGDPQIKDQPTVDDGFTPVLRFMVCSDTHVHGADDTLRLNRIAKALDFCYGEAEKDSSHSTLDAMMVAGDVTNDGYDEQFNAFAGVIQSSLKEETDLLAIVAKNHDGYQGKSCRGKISAITGDDADFHVVIGGYHFIGISTSKLEGLRFDLSQKIWLKKQLDEAVKDDPTKPIFVMHHEHIRGTVYGSSSFEGWGTNNFNAILKQYPQVVDFSGHSHYPINDPRSIWQGAFTAIGTGSISYMEVTVDSDRTQHPEYPGRPECNYDVSAQAWLVEVDAANRIRFRGFDVNDGVYLCEYLVEDVTDPAAFVYTPDNQKDKSSAPEFGATAALSVAKKDDKYVVTCPKAESTDGRPIEVYRITVKTDKGVTTHSEYIVNNYWLPEDKWLDSVDFTISAKPGYQVSVVAENVYDMASQPLTATIS